MRKAGLISVLALALAGFVADGFSADETRILIGSWTGKATGPEGGPPTGDLTVTFVRDAQKAVTGKIVVNAAGGVQYTGEVTKITVLKKVFSGLAIFKLGENPLEVAVTGPLKGKTIQGGFTITAKGQKLGEGTFTITKDAK